MSDGALRKISSVIFWRYRRGGWQYDILCILILLFIFLVPKSVLDGSYFKNEGKSVSSTQVAEDPPEDQQDPAKD